MSAPRGERPAVRPEVVREPAVLQSRLLDLKRSGKTISLVPTMGALHEGHRSLIGVGRGRGDVEVVSIFVNPTQFAPGEDLDKYPRTFEADLDMCGREGVDLVFFPPNDLMYPAGYSTYVNVEGLSERLCGRSRPTHFRGVATVVAKLFLIVQPDVAVFGWKDAQQLLVIRRMARDLNIPVEIVGVETVREPDGLAMSSRNRYLTPEERAQAPTLARALEWARQAAQEGVSEAEALKDGIREQIETQTTARVDYVEVVSMESVQPIERVKPGNTLIALAAFFGSTRLIDNVRL
ncbi:pantoate--beta-alanine ligase [Candidatus Sumerlaeota bacterium]|nr:pantoate--beta-alanine ligase [Candidatus Sumerlaeota bacterium]